MMKMLQKLTASILAISVALFATQAAQGYAINQVVPDLRQPASLAGNSACPIPAHRATAAGSLAVRWSTILGTNPTTILTQDQSTSGRLNEIEQVIQESLAAWMNVPGTKLTPVVLAPLTRAANASACAADGLTSICFDQPDGAFTPGVLAFTRVITADRLGEAIGNGAPSTELGQILDADVYFNPGDSRTTFASTAALPSTPSSYDLESVLTHELGHFLGFSHSTVWSAMMFPFGPAPGTFTGVRPTPQQADAPLSDDDRTGLRVVYPDTADSVHIGSIRGRILPANPLSLPAAPAGVSGIFGAHVVAMDATIGNVVAGVIGGWSCSGAGPVQFDGSYVFERLAAGAGHSYKIYAEPLNGAADPSTISNAIHTLCRNVLTDPGWPAGASCIVPLVNTNFTTRVRSSP